jgi:hypothetical protein
MGSINQCTAISAYKISLTNFSRKTILRRSYSANFFDINKEPGANLFAVRDRNSKMIGRVAEDRLLFLNIIKYGNER